MKAEHTRPNPLPHSESLNELMERLAAKGIKPEETAAFLGKVSDLISSDLYQGLKGLNHQLQQSEWEGVVLDRKTFRLILILFEKMTSIGDCNEPVIDDNDGLILLLNKVYQERGVDFRGYSRPSLIRLISRLLLARGVTSFKEYTRLLDENPLVYEALLDALTVNVTEFLRDKSAFFVLKDLIRQRYPGPEPSPIKIWSAGCATGQEPYTLAMLLLTEYNKKGSDTISIIATDIDPNALAFAKAGIYDKETLKGIDPQWVDRFFIHKDDSYQVTRKVKDLIRFESHNLVSDPPYEGVDIVVCRNVMIYFNLGLQTKVFYKFYKGLKPHGLLLLGRYETLINEARRLFSCINFDARLFQKK